MIVGTGIDIAEVARLEKAIASEAFLDRVYTQAEIAYCRSRQKGAAASFAGRFAAKEAVMKALGTGMRGGSFQEIEIINDELGCPRLQLCGHFQQLAQEKGAKKFWVSISHERSYAVAQCILEG